MRLTNAYKDSHGYSLHRTLFIDTGAVSVTFGSHEDAEKVLCAIDDREVALACVKAQLKATEDTLKLREDQLKRFKKACERVNGPGTLDDALNFLEENGGSEKILVSGNDYRTARELVRYLSRITDEMPDISNESLDYQVAAACERIRRCKEVNDDLETMTLSFNQAKITNAATSRSLARLTKCVSESRDPVSEAEFRLLHWDYTNRDLGDMSKELEKTQDALVRVQADSKDLKSLLKFIPEGYVSPVLVAADRLRDWEAMNQELKTIKQKAQFHKADNAHLESILKCVPQDTADPVEVAIARLSAWDQTNKDLDETVTALTETRKELGSVRSELKDCQQDLTHETLARVHAEREYTREIERQSALATQHYKSTTEWRRKCRKLQYAIVGKYHNPPAGVDSVDDAVHELQILKKAYGQMRVLESGICAYAQRSLRGHTLYDIVSKSLAGIHECCSWLKENKLVGEDDIVSVQTLFDLVRKLHESKERQDEMKKLRDLIVKCCPQHAVMSDDFYARYNARYISESLDRPFRKGDKFGT